MSPPLTDIVARFLSGDRSAEITLMQLLLANIATGAWTIELLRGSNRAFHPLLSQVRPHAGQSEVSALYRQLLDGSQLAYQELAQPRQRLPGEPGMHERRVQLPADVPLPLGCCCACGTRDGVAAVARSFRDGLDVWRGQLPYCAPCLAGELEERRAWNRLALRVLPVLFLVAVALGEIPFLGRVAMFVWSAGVLAWLLGPLPDRRPVRMQAADGSHVTWWIANDSYRALVRDAAQHPTL